MLHFFWNLATFIIALGILITVHEFGHFWVARRCGVMVKRFSIGFGPAICRQRDQWGTEYVIAAIPLGGYVKMLDERIDIVPPERRHEAFNHKSIWQRFAIIAAGPMFNFLFSILAYWLIFMIGVPSYRPIIGDIIPHSIVAQTDISPGMELKSVDGIETPDWDSVRLQLIDKIGYKKIHIDVAAFGSSHIERKILDSRGWSFKSDNQDPIITLGIIPLSPRIQPVLTEVQIGSAAMKAGLQAGDTIVKVNGQQVDSWQWFAMKVKDNPGQALQLTIERQGNTLDITLNLNSKSPGKGGVEGFIGVVPKTIPLPKKYKTVRQYWPLPALTQASAKTWQLMQFTASILGQLVTGNIRLNNLSGPISIAQSAGTSAKHGFICYLMFLALISVNLGIINLFPLPVLDGGHLLFLAIEKLKGRPVSEKMQNFSYRIGSILLVFLMGLALLNDFSKL